MFSLRTLGELQLFSGRPDRSSPLLHEPVRLAVVLILAGARAPFVARERIISLLWPDSPRCRAQNALRQAVHRIRACLGQDALISEGNRLLGLDPEVVHSDVGAFRAAASGGNDEEAQRLYRGTFLPGLAVSSRPEFEDWVAAKRVELRAMACRSAVRMAEAAEARGALGEAAWAWERATTLSWHDEHYLRRWMEILLARGSPAGALEAYRRAATVLRDRVGVSPAPETRALARRIRSSHRSMAVRH